MNKKESEIMSNQKGFTLIEVLAVITLIALIMIVAIPGVYKIREKMNQNAKEKIFNNIIIATKQYAKSQINTIKANNNCEDVKECIINFEFKTLIENGYYTEDNLKNNAKCEYFENTLDTCLDDLPIKITINDEFIKVDILNN